MSETPSEPAPKLRRPRVIGILVVCMLVCVAVVVAATLIGSAARLSTARDDFNAAMTKAARQAEVDDDAHAALASAEGSTFASSVNKLVTSLTSCMGSSATSQAKGDLKQLAGFTTAKGAVPDVLRPMGTPTSEAGYLDAAHKLTTQLAADKVSTAETSADAESILIAQDEVNQELDAIAATVSGTSTKLVSQDVYATGTVKNAYKKSVADVAAEVTQIAPSLTAQSTVKISSAQSAALMTALAVFANECKALGISSVAHKPKPVVVHHTVGANYGYSLTALMWPVGNHGVNAFGVDINVSSGTWALNCPATGVVAQGTTSGPRGTITTINVAGNGGYIRFLQTWLSPTTVKWAIVSCKSK